MLEITRKEVLRISQVGFVDGTDMVGEALEYSAPCGCTVVYGVRFKGGLNEKCCLIWPCDQHHNLRENLLAAAQKDHFMYPYETEDVIRWAIEND